MYGRGSCAEQVLIERGLSIVFDHRLYRQFADGRGLKVVIAFVVSWFICDYYDFDVIAALLEPSAITFSGKAITAAVVAGGSAAAVKLFQDVLGFSRTAREALKETQAAEAEAKKLEAEVRVTEAKKALGQA